MACHVAAHMQGTSMGVALNGRGAGGARASVRFCSECYEL